MSWINENGVPIETPRMGKPLDLDDEVRATILLWDALKQADVPIQSIAACFRVSRQIICEYIKQIPESARMDYGSEELVGRLRAASSEGRRPRTSLDVRRIIKAACTINLP